MLVNTVRISNRKDFNKIMVILESKIYEFNSCEEATEVIKIYYLF